jgi:uncharacterized protein (TIGR02444 family)
MSLWDFSVAVHARPNVDAICLELQDDHGQCVSLLLWRLWTVVEGRAVGSETLETAATCARLWDGAAVSPLRAVRRRLKAPHTPIPDEARLALRTRIAEVEFAAEKLLLETLEALTPPPGGDGEAPFAALAALGAHWGKPAPGEPLERLIAAAL